MLEHMAWVISNYGKTVTWSKTALFYFLSIRGVAVKKSVKCISFMLLICKAK